MAACTFCSLFTLLDDCDSSSGITLKVKKSFSLISLRNSSAGRRFIDQQNWYDDFGWSLEEIPPGVYHLRLPIQGSANRKFAQQKRLLSDGEAVAPVALVAAAILAIQQSGKPNPLEDRWTRCAEVNFLGDHVALNWSNGQLGVGGAFSDKMPEEDLWLASVNTSGPCLSSL